MDLESAELELDYDLGGGELGSSIVVLDSNSENGTTSGGLSEEVECCMAANKVDSAISPLGQLLIDDPYDPEARLNNGTMEMPTYPVEALLRTKSEAGSLDSISIDGSSLARTVPSLYSDLEEDITEGRTAPPSQSATHNSAMALNVKVPKPRCSYWRELLIIVMFFTILIQAAVIFSSQMYHQRQPGDLGVTDAPTHDHTDTAAMEETKPSVNAGELNEEKADAASSSSEDGLMSIGWAWKAWLVDQYVDTTFFHFEDGVPLAYAVFAAIIGTAAITFYLWRSKPSELPEPAITPACKPGTSDTVSATTYVASLASAMATEEAKMVEQWRSMFGMETSVDFPSLLKYYESAESTSVSTVTSESTVWTIFEIAQQMLPGTIDLNSSSFKEIRERVEHVLLQDYVARVKEALDIDTAHVTLREAARRALEGAGARYYHVDKLLKLIDGEHKALMEKAKLHDEKLVNTQLEQGEKEMKGCHIFLLNFADSSQPTHGMELLYGVYETRAKHSLKLFDSWRRSSGPDATTLRENLADGLYATYNAARMEVNVKFEEENHRRISEADSKALRKKVCNLVGCVIGAVLSIAGVRMSPMEYALQQFVIIYTLLVLAMAPLVLAVAPSRLWANYTKLELLPLCQKVECMSCEDSASIAKVEVPQGDHQAQNEPSPR